MMSHKKKVYPNPSVLIIGAGVAGISAARHLRQHGYTNVQILEAKHRIGGRIFTVPFGKSAGNFVELGANWIHGASVQNPLFTTAIENGHLKSQDLELVDRRVGLFYTSDGRIIDPKLAFAAFDIFMKLDLEASEIESNTKISTLKEYLDHHLERHLADASSEQVRKDLERVFNCMINYLTFHVGDTLNRVSLGVYGKYEEIPGGDAILPTGFMSILKSFTDGWSRDFIKLGMKVNKINWNNTETISVECDAGTILNADHVILTLPLGYLKRNHSTIFNPRLPMHKQHAIADLGFGRVNKIFLYYTEPFWPKGMQSIHLAWTSDEMRTGDWVRDIFGFDEVLNNDHVLVAWISGHGAEIMEKLSEEEVAQRCTQVLRKFTNNPSVSLPARVLRSQWCSDDLTCGSYTYLPVGCPVESLYDLAEPLPSVHNPRILFAGEATHDKYFSTAHGAMLTGIREADRLIGYYDVKISKL